MWGEREPTLADPEDACIGMLEGGNEETFQSEHKLEQGEDNNEKCCEADAEKNVLRLLVPGNLLAYSSSDFQLFTLHRQDVANRSRKRVKQTAEGRFRPLLEERGLSVFHF